MMNLSRTEHWSRTNMQNYHHFTDYSVLICLQYEEVEADLVRCADEIIVFWCMRSFEHFPMDFIVNLLDLNAFSDEFLMKQKQILWQEERNIYETINQRGCVLEVLNLLKLLWFGATNDGMMRSFEHFPLDFICFCL
eukprot:973424_1